MSASAAVLIFSEDSKLRDEVGSALRPLGEEEPRYRFVSDTNHLFEALRTQAISIVLAEFPQQPKELNSLVRQIQAAAPETAVAAIIRPEGFPDNVSESAVLIDAMRSGVCDFLRRPLSTADLRRLLEMRRLQRSASLITKKPRGRVVTFVSNKGGVGKSTLATNCAVLAARRKAGSVLLIDGSLQMGVAAALLDLRPAATLTDLARESERLDATMIRQSAAVHSSGLHLLAAPADAVEAMEVDDLLMARLITLARQTYDLVVVDTFPMFDRVVIATLDLSDHAYVILENVVPTLLGGIKLLDVLGRIGYPPERQSVVVNRFQRVGGALSLDDVAQRLGREIEHVLPFDKRVMAAANTGDPVAMHTVRFGGFSRSLQRLTLHVLGGTTQLPQELDSHQRHGLDESSLIDAPSPGSPDAGAVRVNGQADRETWESTP